MRELPPALVDGATLAGLAAGIRTQGFEAPRDDAPAAEH